MALKKSVGWVASVFLLLSVFGGVYAADNEGVIADVVFDADVAGVTPDDWYYFLDFAGTPEERINEAGLMVESGDFESARKALVRFNGEIADVKTQVESISSDGAAIDGFAESPATQEYLSLLGPWIEYEYYVEAIQESLDSQTESGVIDESTSEGFLDETEDSLAEGGAVLEETRLELVEATAEVSDASTFEVESVFEELMNSDLRERVEAIADTSDVLALREQIDSLEDEADALEEAGDNERANSIRALIDIAERHATECLHADEIESDFESYGHLQTAEESIVNAERLAEGLPLESLDSSVVLDVEVPSAEDLQEENAREVRHAEEFIEDYDSLRERYSDDSVRLAAIEAEKERADKARQLGELLQEGNVMETWTAKFSAQGLTGEDLAQAIHEEWTKEWNYVYHEQYPEGMYVNPGNDDLIAPEGESGDSGLETVPIGRIEFVESIDPVSGEVVRDVVGWRDGSIVEDISTGGGFALGVPYTDPVSGVTTTFSESGYSYLTPAGMVYSVEYPEGYKEDMQNTFDTGSEVIKYKTSDGTEMIYSPTGYEVLDSEGNVLVSQPYEQEFTFFVDGSVVDLEPSGYIFNDDGGDARAFVYNAEFGTYQDPVAGTVSIMPVAPHAESTYNPESQSFDYSYNGVVFSYKNGVWQDSTGQTIAAAPVPAPVGFEERGSYTSPNGQTWTYDGQVWKESTTSQVYVPSPNNYYYYDSNDGKSVDSKGNWADSADGRNQGYRSVWSYDSAEGKWVSGDTGDRYDPKTGETTRADGTKIDSSLESADGKKYSYGQYYSDGSDSRGQTFTYDYGGSYYRAPDGKYTYESSSGVYNGPSKVTDAAGNVWSRDSSGTWSSSSGESYAPSASNYYSGGAYAEGSSGAGGASYEANFRYENGVATQTNVYDGSTWTQGSDGSWGCSSGCSGASSGSYYSGSGSYSGSYSGSGSGTEGYSGSYYSGGHAGGPGSSYPGYSSAGSGAYGGGYDSAGNYVGGSYGGYDSSGSYVGTGPSDSGSGSYSGGSYSGGGESGGSSGDSSGGSGSSGDSGGSSGGSGGDSGGSGGSTGGAVTDIPGAQDSSSFTARLRGWFARIFRR